MLALKAHRTIVEPRVIFQCTVLSGDLERAVFRIDGLLCSLCAANVRRSLGRVEGVIEARVDLDAGIAQVDYDPDYVSTRDLKEAIERTVILRPLRRALARLARASRGRF
jgi:copper chaperone CopZ